MEHSYRGLRVVGLVVLIAAATACSRSTPQQAARVGGLHEVPAADQSRDVRGGGGTAAAETTATWNNADRCVLISQSDVAAAVGNAVAKGEQQIGGGCKWQAATVEDVDVLLIAHPKGNTFEPSLCTQVRKNGGDEKVEGLDVATWKFSKIVGPINSGELEGCGPKGYLSLQLNGKRDEAPLKKAALVIADHVLRQQ